MAHAIGRDRVGQGLRDLSLADELTEILRPIAAGHHDVLRITRGIVAERLFSHAPNPNLARTPRPNRNLALNPLRLASVAAAQPSRRRRKIRKMIRIKIRSKITT